MNPTQQIVIHQSYSDQFWYNAQQDGSAVIYIFWIIVACVVTCGLIIGISVLNEKIKNVRRRRGW